MARPLGAENKDKPFREALRIELASRGTNLKALRKIAAAVIDKASEGDTSAAFQIRDTLDGKPMQATEVTGKDGGAIQVDSLDTATRTRALAAFVAKTKSDK